LLRQSCHFSPGSGTYIQVSAVKADRMTTCIGHLSEQFPAPNLGADDSGSAILGLLQTRADIFILSFGDLHGSGQSRARLRNGFIVVWDSNCFGARSTSDFSQRLKAFSKLVELSISPSSWFPPPEPFPPVAPRTSALLVLAVSESLSPTLLTVYFSFGIFKLTK